MEQRFRVGLGIVPVSDAQVLRLEHASCNCWKVPNLTDPQHRDNEIHLHLVPLNFKDLVQLYNFQVKCLKYRVFFVKITPFL